MTYATRRRAWLPGTMAVLLAMTGTGTAAIGAAAAETAPPSITVEGNASGTVVPDTATLDLGIAIERPTAATATGDLAKAAQAVRAAVTAEGIDAKDVTTASLALMPLYPDPKPGEAPKPARLFRASTSLRITVRPAERAGPLASRLVNEGATTIEGVSYAASQTDAQRDTLRAEAVRDALRKAKITIGALGLTLGPVLEITPEDDGAAPPPPMMRMAMAAKAALPSEPGTQTLRATVRIRWAIGPAAAASTKD